jgi:succinate dehydrogenase/fumarate reductase cytochrome b subunit
MNNVSLALDGAWKVLTISLLLGAGLPVLFAAGVRSMAWSAGGGAQLEQERPHPAGRALAALCFLVVVAGVALGITIVVASGFGQAVSFASLYPTIVSK